MKRLLSGLAVLAIAWAAGLVFFIAALPAPPQSAPGEADGVVVYTGGGGARISAGMKIFAGGAGERMLISGVHPDTSLARLSEFWSGPAERFDCCIDLGHAALTTEGNAGELRDWADTHRYTRLILVTSDYHMPRAVAVTKARMPGAAITPYAVASGYLGDNGLPVSAKATVRLAGEYTKYLLARIKAFVPLNGR